MPKVGTDTWYTLVWEDMRCRRLTGALHARGFSDFLAARGPLLDARSPAEWAAGHVPGALNVPVLTDAHRAVVGAVFAERGRDAAVQHALELVGPRMGALAAEAKRHAGAGPVRVYCARGGLRSASLAWLLSSLLAAPSVSVAPGGYKAYRGWVQSAFARRRPLAVLGGATGCGKTRVLSALASSGAAVVDLEALARHRGSAFGGVGSVHQQPTNEQFENDLAQELSRADCMVGPVWVEDERRSIGRCYVPAALLAQMEAAPKVLMHAGVEARLRNIAEDYAGAPLTDLADATARISRKLGSERARSVQEALKRCNTGEAAALLLPYYDRTYEHALGRRMADTGPVLEVRAGEEWGVSQWAAHLPAIMAAWAPAHAAAVGEEGEGAVQDEAWLQSWSAAGSRDVVRLVVRHGNGAR